MYNPCYSSSSTGEIITEDYIPKSPSEATDLEFTYLVNAILGEEQDQNREEDDLENVSDNESLHSEDWKFPQKKNRHTPLGNGYDHTAQSAEVEEDRLSVAKTVVGKSRPTTGQLKPKVPDYLVHNGVHHYWTAVEVSTVVRTPKEELSPLFCPLTIAQGEEMFHRALHFTIS